MAQFVAPIRESFTTTGVGVTHSSNGATKQYTLLVYGSAVATDWVVDLEVSLDGIHFEAIGTNNKAVGDSKHWFSGPVEYGALYFRCNVKSLTLGPASNITVVMLALKV